MRITPIILSGGGGTRLWPMSRPERPKQFLALTGDKTMFQLTVQRTNNVEIFAPPVVVAGTAHAEIAAQQLGDIDVSGATIILEPSARNTAPAIALAAVLMDDPDTVMLVMPSDHVINNLASFHAAINAALPAAQTGWMVTFGIEPSAPETGYGYIKAAEAVKAGVFRVDQFIEKPDAPRAVDMIACGGHYWNAGIFLFTARTFLSALGLYAPDMLAAARAAMAAAEKIGNVIYPDAAAFAASPADSIDYAVLEKAEHVAVIPADMGWSDVGSWDALHALGIDATPALVTDLNGSGNMIRSDGIRIHLAGVHDMIVVASGNDILIVPRGKSQQVKSIVDALKQQNAS